ncbi:hypothetical protein BKA93DRAFT_511162 [Sparassis latifolia]
MLCPLWHLLIFSAPILLFPLFSRTLVRMGKTLSVNHGSGSTALAMLFCARPRKRRTLSQSFSAPFAPYPRCTSSGVGPQPRSRRSSPCTAHTRNTHPWFSSSLTVDARVHLLPSDKLVISSSQGTAGWRYGLRYSYRPWGRCVSILGGPGWRALRS